jgi:hypothetical protein
MSARGALLLLLSLSTLAFLAACGNNGNGITQGQAPPSGAFSDSNLNGTYVFSVSGVDADGDAYTAGGTIIANGSGAITGGTLDMNSTDTAVFTSGPVIAAPINSNGGYTVGKDGRGEFTISLPTGDNPFGGDLTFDFVLQNSFHGQVTEFDGDATGSGTLDVQTAGTTPTGPYAFSLAGATYAGSTFATVGNFTLTGSSITTGLEDFNSGGAPETNGGVGYPLSGTVVAGGSTSSLSSLTTSSTFGTSGTLTFDVYPIDSTHLKFIEVDSYATLSGDAFTEATSVPTGNLVFTLDGILSGTTPFAAGGLMVTSGGSIVSGSTEDYNSGGTSISTPGSPIPFTGNYSGANGRFALALSSFIGGVDYVAYPSSGGMFLLETDSSTLSIEAGAAYAQVSGASFAASQGYGLNLSGDNESGEVDDIAEFTASASGASCVASTSTGDVTYSSDTIIGVVDENSDSGDGPTPGSALCGQYGSIDTSGRLGLTYYSPNLLNGGAELTAYTVDGTIFPFIEADSGQVSTGVFILQNAAATSPSMAKPRSMFVPHPMIRPNAKHAKTLQKQN